MAADLREMQENQGFSENLIDKLEFVDLSDFILQNMNNLQTVAFVPLAYDPVANRNDSEQKLKEVKI